MAEVDFDQEFLDNLSIEVLTQLTKERLRLLADKVGASINSSMKKKDLIDVIGNHLGLVNEEAASKVVVSDVEMARIELEREKLVFEMKRIEMERVREKENREFEREKEKEKQNEREKQEFEREKEKEKQEFEREKREFEREREKKNQEFELMKLELAKQSGHTIQVNKSHDSEITQNIKWVPKFNEEEVETYFLAFEKIANRLKWPVGHWTVLLQTALVGKAQEVFSSLADDKCESYEAVKEAVLSAYELVPEAYRQKFRNLRKLSEQTFTEFARKKQVLFDRWCSSNGVNGEFNKIRELMLVEEFKSCSPIEVRTHLEEQKVNNLMNAATIADNYVLTHKSIVNKFAVPKIVNESNVTNQKAQSTTVSGKMVKSCYYCKKKGHIKADCWLLQGKNKGLKPFPTALISDVQLKEPMSSVDDAEKLIKSSDPGKVRKLFKPFLSTGSVSLVNDVNLSKVRVLRDTGASQSLILSTALPFSEESSAGASVLIQGVEGGYKEVPLHVVHIETDLVCGNFVVGVVPSLPVWGVTLLLGNDLAGDRVVLEPVVCKSPVEEESTERLEKELSHVFPSCVVTRSMVNKTIDESIDLSDSFFSEMVDGGAGVSPETVCSGPESLIAHTERCPKVCDFGPTVLNRSRLLEEQGKDSDILSLGQKALSVDEMPTVPVCYYKKDGILMRKWRPPDVPSDEAWNEIHQIVVPIGYRQDIIGIAHDGPLSGHLGINKTVERILKYFFWPGLRKDVCKYCKSCHACQIVGKPNQKVPVAPLKPIPAFGEPFSRVIVDCVGPLPRTKTGNEYLLTIMCASSRFPEAIPLRRITAKNVVKALVKFFTLVGLPNAVQSDQGSNFMSKVFNQVLDQLGVAHVNSSAYHPQSQGALERFHQTLKNMLRTYCFECEKEWDEGVPLLLFAVRETVQESLGFSPFELIYGHSVRGPLKIVQERLIGNVDETVTILDYVSEFRDRLNRARDMARKNLVKAQAKMKRMFDRKAEERSFSPGDEVLVMLPLPSQPLSARFAGPYKIVEKVGEVDYVLDTPDRRKKKRLCHVNMLKQYVARESNGTPKPVLCSMEENVERSDQPTEEFNNPDACIKFSNSDVLEDIERKVSHLSVDQKTEIVSVIFGNLQLFSDVPGRTDLVEHDIDTGDNPSLKQNPYRANPFKMKILQDEIDYMMKNDIIEPSSSGWSSPCVLVPKPDKSYRFCTDYRKVNTLSKTDSYPIPRIDDCIDRVGSARYVSKFDLLKGYWQIPLTERAKEVSAFVTPMGLYQYKVMPFGLKNAPATFQRLVNGIISGLEGCEAYVDDLVVYSDSWDVHVERIKALFERLTAAKLTVNLVKSEFSCAEIVFLGHVVGCGKVKPLIAKVEAIRNFPVPTSKQELMRFLGMAGFYRRFCKSFSMLVAPLTNLLRKNVSFDWCKECTEAFEKVKAMLSNHPVLMAPNFQKPFSLMIDASDVGAGAVLGQKDDNGIDKPVCFFSRKFNKHEKRYSTVEKETLALMFALKHFEVYLTTPFPIVVWTDHNPLTFLAKMKNKNQRLLRWSLAVQELNLEIHHIKGKDNVVADALSRV